MERLMRRFCIPPLAILMLFPWTRLTEAFDSDIQPYSLFYALFLTAICGAAFVARGKWRLSKAEGFALLASIFLIAELMVIISISGGTEALRGAYQYLNGASFFLLIFLLMNLYRSSRAPFVSDHVVVGAFCVWVVVGVIQMVYDKSLMTSMVSRSVVTTDRGAISLSSEPGYFGYTLIFFGLYFAMVGRRYLAILAFVLVPMLTMSAASVAWLGILMVIFLAFRYGSKAVLLLAILAFCAYGLGSVLVSMPSLAEYRVIALLGHLYNDKTALILDGSINIRLVHLYYSHLGFLESHGVPNGVLYWPTYLSSRIGGVSFLWDTGLNQTNRINSGMGGVLFEGGWLSVMVLAAIFGLIRQLSSSRREFVLYVVVFVYLFYAGFNFRIPFLYLLFMAAFVRKQRSVLGASEMTESDPSTPVSRMPTSATVTPHSGAVVGLRPLPK